MDEVTERALSTLSTPSTSSTLPSGPEWPLIRRPGRIPRGGAASADLLQNGPGALGDIKQVVADALHVTEDV